MKRGALYDLKYRNYKEGDLDFQIFSWIKQVRDVTANGGKHIFVPNMTDDEEFYSLVNNSCPRVTKKKKIQLWKGIHVDQKNKIYS
jgi:hypothetical protein